MTELFIQKSIQKHGIKYSYDKTIYVKACEKVIITCNECNEDFRVTPNKHLSRGDGCRKCSMKKVHDNQRGSLEEFIRKSRETHGDKFDYSQSVYTNSKTLITIICPIINHGPFEQTPNNHLSGFNGCTYCVNQHLSFLHRDTKEEFERKARQIHNGLYTYNNIDYVNAHTYVNITCVKHGDFQQTPNSHLSGATCLSCCNELSSENQRRTTEDFIKLAKLKHPTKIYNYDLVQYGKNQNDCVTIICPTHGKFSQTPGGHLSGSGCRLCCNELSSENQRFTYEEFVEMATTKWGDKFDYSKSIYINSQTPVQITCIEHDNTFYQIPNGHYRSSGCVKCHNSGYSNVAINWLKFISIYYNIQVNHADNGGEYRIHTTRYSADGYCAETNTVYEFHGDYWHGNPRIYNPNLVNHFGKPFGELYKKTVLREQEIIGLGYTLVVMWESDWITLNKCVRLLQRIFRKYKQQFKKLYCMEACHQDVSMNSYNYQFV